MRVLPARRAAPREARRLILGPWSPEFSPSGLILPQRAQVSTTWFSANDPLAIPFRLSNAAIVDQLGWVNGSSAGGGVDVGVYDSAWTRLVSTGSQTGSGNNAWQWIDVAATTIRPGPTYYLAMSRDNITANRVRAAAVGGLAGALALAGCQDSATDAYPLPNPLTNMALAATATTVPIVAIGFRAPF